MRSFFLTCILLLFSLALYGQSLKHVQGELLLQVESKSVIVDLNRDVLLEGVSFTEVINKPMSIWKASFNFASKNEIELLRYLKTHPKVISAQVNHLLQERLIPNDPQIEMQWQYIQLLSPSGNPDIDLDADEAWEIATGGLTPLGDTIVVCVIDDGLDFSHDEFQKNIWTNHNEIPNNGIDEDNNGYADDYHGWNTYANDSNVDQDGSHGTPVAGIIGAEGNNGIGVSGVNWNVQLMIIRGGGDEANALASYAYPYYFRKLYNETNGEEGAFVVATNASWGTDYGDPEDAPIWCSFYDSLGVQGIISCGATANREINIDIEGDLPTGCSSDFLISVTNMNRNDDKVNGAGFGLETIDLGAFGEGTWTTAASNGYRSFGGTSGATPHVTGAVALLYSAPCQDFADFSKLDPAGAALLTKHYIMNGVDPNESLESITVSGGRLNLNSALTNLMASCTGCPLVSNVTLVAPNLNQLVFEWEDQEETSEINLRYRLVGEEEWILVENVTSPHIVSNPTYCSEYEIQFQTKCNEIENIFFGNHTIRTEGCCEINDEYELEVIMEGANNSNLTIPNVLVADNYYIDWKLTSDSIWTSVQPNEFGEFIFDEGTNDCVSIDYRVQASCGSAISDTSYFSGYYFNCSSCGDLEYCELDPINSSFEWIDQVVFGNETFVSGPPEEKDGGRSNFVGIKSFQFSREQVIDFSIQPAFQSLTYEEFYQIWIDFNQDGILSDEDELAFQSAGAIDTTEFGAFVIPEDAKLGITRMRVSMSYDAMTISCGDSFFEFGETEDYCVTIREPSAVIENVELDIFLYPNPAIDYLEVRNLLYEGELRIHSLDGKEVYFKKILPNNNSNVIILPPQLDAGLYLISYRAIGKSWVEKFVKI